MFIKKNKKELERHKEKLITEYIELIKKREEDKKLEEEINCFLNQFCQNKEDLARIREYGYWRTIYHLFLAKAKKQKQEKLYPFLAEISHLIKLEEDIRYRKNRLTKIENKLTKEDLHKIRLDLMQKKEENIFSR